MTWRSRCRVTRRDRGRPPLGRRRRRDLLGLLTGEVLRPLVPEVDPQDVRTAPGLRGEGQGHERQVLLLVRLCLLVDTRQHVRHERGQRPVDRRRCRRLGPLVVQHEEDGVRHLRVVLVVAGVRVGDVEPLGVAVLVGQPHLESVLGTRFVCELLHPGVGLGDGEVADHRVGERLDIGVPERRVHADLGDELLELRVLVRGLERRRDAVRPHPALGVGHRVAVELVVGAALGHVREQLAGLDRQVLRGGVGSHGRPENVRGDHVAGPYHGECCHCHGRDGRELPGLGASLCLDHGEDRRDEDEEQGPPARSQRREGQEAGAQDERDSRPGAAGTDGPDQGARRDDEPRSCPGEEVVGGPDEQERRGGEGGDAGHVGTTTEQGTGRQGQSQEKNYDEDHRLTCPFLVLRSVVLGLATRAASGLCVAAEEPHATCYGRSPRQVVDETVERTVVGCRRQQASGFARPVEGSAVAAALGHCPREVADTRELVRRVGGAQHHEEVPHLGVVHVRCEANEHLGTEQSVVLLLVAGPVVFQVRGDLVGETLVVTLGKLSSHG